MLLIIKSQILIVIIRNNIMPKTVFIQDKCNLVRYKALISYLFFDHWMQGPNLCHIDLMGLYGILSHTRGSCLVDSIHS